MNTIGGALRNAEESLTVAGIPDAPSEAEALLAAFLKTSTTQVHARGREALSDEQEKRLADWIAVRRARQPLCYVSGEAVFGDFVLSVNENVLIPRPETEELFEKMKNSLPADAEFRAADIGTGSGCLAISLAASFQRATIYATDISEAALNVARANARRHQLDARIEWRHGDLWDALDGRFDVIVANLPYIREDVIPMLEPEVLREPHVALSGGPDGLALLKRFSSAAPHYLNPGGRVFLEIGFDQGAAVKSLLTQAGFDHVKCERDLSGNERFVTGIWLGKEGQ